jgi:hypothetical protein
MPFVRLLRGDPRVPPEALSELEALDPDERVPIATVQEWLAAAIVITGDLDIGLKAAREIAAGDYGAVEYAARSAATWGEASVAVGRYMRLINDALRFSVEVEGERALIQLDSIVPLPRSASDSTSAARSSGPPTFRRSSRCFLRILSRPTRASTSGLSSAQPCASTRRSMVSTYRAATSIYRSRARTPSCTR